MALLSTDREGVVVKKNYNRIYWAGTDSSDSDDSNADYDSGNDVNSDIFLQSIYRWIQLFHPTLQMIMTFDYFSDLTI